MSKCEQITREELHARMKAQGVSGREHIAFKCPVCGTAQSIASLLKAGAPADRVENAIGFSCEGRFNGAGAWPRNPDERRRAIRGCDWTLGGLFQIHKLELIGGSHDGESLPLFEIATAEEAQALEAAMSAPARPRPTMT